MKSICVALLPDLIEIDSLEEWDVVVVDVLRATSVMAVALAAGADSIRTCRELSEAFAIAESVDPRPLLCGERGGVPIDGFDLGNSPSEYTARRVAGRHLVQTTTNGTRAIQLTAAARRQLTCSFLNSAATLRATAAAAQLLVVCAGTDGRVTGEDILLAGKLCSESGREVCGDQAQIAMAYWQQSAAQCKTADGLARLLGQTRGGINLQRLGYGADLQTVAECDSVDVVAECVDRKNSIFRRS